MGFVHDVHMCQFIPPSQIQKSAGTWTPTLASNTVGDVRSAADASFNLFVPIRLPSNASALKGAYLKSIDVFYKVLTAACDDFATVELEKMTLGTAGVITGAAVSCTIDTGHDANTERLAVADHKMVVTLDTPIWIDDDNALVLYMVVDAAATTVFTIWGARANYTLRL